MLENVLTSPSHLDLQGYTQRFVSKHFIKALNVLSARASVAIVDLLP